MQFKITQFPKILDNGITLLYPLNLFWSICGLKSISRKSFRRFSAVNEAVEMEGGWHRLH